MPSVRSILAVLAGFVAWFAVATACDHLLRAVSPGYLAAEHGLTFTLSMMVARLGLGVLSSLVGGYVCSAVARGGRGAVYSCAAVMVLCFLPVHYKLWHTFPVWYHLFFLVTLAPLMVLGASLQRRQAAPSSSRP